MPVDKNLVVIGASDEETAHLRLLIRKAGGKLTHRWRWGSEAGADLVVVDPEAFAGQMARTRALAGGLRCAVIVDEMPPSSELVLRRPLREENVVDVLNRAGGAMSMAPPLEKGRGHLYLDDDAHDGADIVTRMFEEGIASHPPLTPRSTEPPALGFDEVFRRDEAAEKPMFRVPLSLDGDTRLEVTDAPSARSEARWGESVDALAPQPRGAGPNVALPGVKRAAADGSRHALRAFVDQPLLGGPAQIVLEGVPALTLDPKHATFYTVATLAELERYLREPLARADWRALTTAELGQVRDTQPGWPYRRLVWLDVLVNSDGRLASQLDPGGTYRLKQRLEVGADHRGHERIVRAMAEPARLNEIAAKAGVPMGAVFDVVNAYHAIGEVEWQSRASLRLPAKPEDKGGLLSRLKRPFGR
jgi:hypothetical protein